jgi:hypothetical protein
MLVALEQNNNALHFTSTAQYLFSMHHVLGIEDKEINRNQSSPLRFIV